MVGAVLGLAFIVCLFLLSGCGSGSTKINPARTSLSQHVTYDKSGNPVAATSTAEAVGPSMTSDQAKDFAGELGTPELTLAPLPGNPVPPAGPGAAGAGSNRVTGSFFNLSSGGGRWILYGLGGVFFLAGLFVAFKFGQLMLGGLLAGGGAFVVAATIWPILWLAVIVAVLGFAAWSVIQTKRSHQDQSALIGLAKYVDQQDKPVEVDRGDGVKVVKMVNPAKEEIAKLATPSMKAAIARIKKRL